MGGHQSSPEFEVPPNRTFIVTGGNTGIGYETAKHIAQLGGRVVIACRSEERAKQAIARMQEETGEEQNGANTNVDPVKPLDVQYMHLDLSSLQSTAEFAQRYKESGLPLNVLICNAGIFAMERGLTDDGFERMFQINYLSHFLLTLLLLPLLKKSAPNSRVINVSSGIYKYVKVVDLNNIQGQQSFHHHPFYSNSKIFQIMNMYTLSERIKDDKISIFSLHPGIVATEIGREFQGVMKAVAALILYLPIAKDTRTGSFPTLNAALNPEYDNQTGVYFDQLQPTETTDIARQEDYQETLWQYSLECLSVYLNDEILQEVGETMADIKPLMEGKEELQDEEAENVVTDAGAENAEKNVE